MKLLAIFDHFGILGSSHRHCCSDGINIDLLRLLVVEDLRTANNIVSSGLVTSRAYRNGLHVYE